MTVLRQEYRDGMARLGAAVKVVVKVGLRGRSGMRNVASALPAYGMALLGVSLLSLPLFDGAVINFATAGPKRYCGERDRATGGGAVRAAGLLAILDGGTPGVRGDAHRNFHPTDACAMRLAVIDHGSRSHDSRDDQRRARKSGCVRGATRRPFFATA
jgi:hypothetical protein